MPQEAQRWYLKPERGTELGLRFMLWFYQLLGKPLTRLLLYPVVVYFYLTDRTARKHSRIFFERVYRNSGEKSALNQPPSAWDSFKRFYNFGCSLVDSIEIWSGTQWFAKVKWHGLECIERLNEQKKGAVIVSAHLGNVDAMRVVAQSKTSKQIKALMYTDHAQRFNKLLEQLNPDASKDIIPLETIDAMTVLELQSLVEQGDTLGILADRAAVGSQDRTIEVSFFGKPAPFPQGPWILASLLKCRIFLLFCIRTDRSHYEVFIEPFAEQIILPRQQREEKLRHWVGVYAARLEAFCRQYPHHWFNFYNFWADDV